MQWRERTKKRRISLHFSCTRSLRFTVTPNPCILLYPARSNALLLAITNRSALDHIDNHNCAALSICHAPPKIQFVFSLFKNNQRLQGKRGQITVKPCEDHRITQSQESTGQNEVQGSQTGEQNTTLLRILFDQCDSSIHMCWLPIGQYLGTQRETKRLNWVVDHKAQLLQLQKWLYLPAMLMIVIIDGNVVIMTIRVKREEHGDK